MQLPHFVFIASGTMGDFLPFMALARELKRRKYEVTIIANNYFQRIAETEGIAFRESGSLTDYIGARQDYQSLSQDNRWKKLFERYHSPATYKEFAAVQEINKQHRVFVVCYGANNGGCMAAEKLRLPFASIVLAPSLALERHNTRYKPQSFAQRAAWLVETYLRTPLHRTKTFATRQIPINRIRRALGLRSISFYSYMLRKKNWSDSPNITIALFPEWFDEMICENFKDINAVGFPFARQTIRENFDMLDLQQFVAKYGAPVAFIPGSGVLDADLFFEDAIAMQNNLNMPALFICPDNYHVKFSLPDNIKKLKFQPLHLALPLCCAVVHHGGIGTIAEAIGAGIPQIVRAVEFDQPRNAYLLCRMGIAAAKMAPEFDPKKMARSLVTLLNSNDVAKKLHLYSTMTKEFDAVNLACDLLEDQAKKLSL